MITFVKTLENESKFIVIESKSVWGGREGCKSRVEWKGRD